MQNKTKWGTNTRLIHEGYNRHDYYGFVNPPVVRASTVLFPNAEVMKAGSHPYIYGTHGTPTTDALAQAINALEGAAKTVLVPSGLAAITVPLLGVLKTGDHVLFADSVYYPTRRFADNILKNMGVEVEYYDPLIGRGIADLMRANTKVVYTESPGTITFEIQDIPAIVEAAHKRDALVMMDNTWATPLYFRPLDFGVDISIQAATKYPGGHADVLLGLISANDRYANMLEETHICLGMSVAADDAYLVLRGLRSMGVRLQHQSKTALELAHWLEGRPEVARVLHPALPSFAEHALWKRDFSGASSLFSFVLRTGGEEQANAFLNALQIFGLGFSWGGYESLATHADISFRTITQNKYDAPIIRLQIGLEDLEDLKEDLDKAFAATGL